MPPYPRAIVHFDGDSFFASIEQALNYRLKGKPVVTGAERGAATSLSYEAKRRGARRGMSVAEIKRLCPDVVFVAGDYTAYSIFARRMYAIVRSFAPCVEEYSIDECFADVTGLDRKYGSYEALALRIKAQLESDLGITFGVGLAPTKTLAKVASKHRKPAGFTAIPMQEIPAFLEELPIGSVWGMGFATSLKFEKLGVHTAGAFVAKDRAWLDEKRVAKPYREIWMELNGICVRPIRPDTDDTIGSIMKSRTFTPTRDRAVLLSQLAKNIEGACAKARRHAVAARRLRFYLKTQEFRYAGVELTLAAPSTDPRPFIRLAEAHLHEAYVPGELYRATGVTLAGLSSAGAVTPDLFGAYAEEERALPVLAAVDRLNRRFGQATVFLGASMTARLRDAADPKARRGKAHGKVELSPEKRRKSLDIPFLGTAH